MEKVINKYLIELNQDGYVCGFNTVAEGAYDFSGQMADIPEACEGWYRFVPGNPSDVNQFVVDQVKKAEIIAEREAELRRPTDFDRVEAQSTFTALMTDTLLPEEEA